MQAFYEGGEAVVEQAIQPGKRGRVYFRGSWWFARCERDITLEPGEVVTVVGLSNITLLVEPVDKSASQSLFTVSAIL